MRRLSERGLVKASLAMPFMTSPMNIRKAMLNPTEKRTLSVIARFFKASSFRITMPGTSRR
jgi:hypothetical protein